MGCVAAAVACLVVIYAAIRFFNPYDEVQPAISGIPTDTDFLCLVDKTKSGPEAMPWYIHKVGPDTIHPDNGSELREWDRGLFQKRVQWISSSRVGVLRRTKDRNGSCHGLMRRSQN
jgi:hypothetical protein